MLKAARSLTSMAATEGPVAKVIREKLTRRFSPVHLTVECESHLHNVPKGTEKHFLVHVVSDQFEGKRVIERHRMVNDCLSQELKEGVHALRIEAVPSSKWDGSLPDQGPNCMGGANR